MTRVRSPSLYKALKNIFKSIDIHSQGEKASVYGGGSWLSTKRRAPEIKGGERYSVTCPYCHRKGKLWLSYKIGEVTKETILEGRGYLNCFRCDFQKDKRVLKEFLNKLGKVVGGAPPSEMGFIEEEEEERKEDREAPVLFTLSDEDAYLHRGYLERRRFNPLDLSKQWGLSCSTDPRWFTTTRIIIPICISGIEVGWQARHLDTPGTEGESKYLFPPGFNKAAWLYNQDSAMTLSRKTGTVVICEGVFDVFRVGKHAVGIFGKKASDIQIGKISNLFKGLRVVVLLDNEADARKDAFALSLKLQASGLFSSVEDLYFPDGDPADHTREEVDKLTKLTVNQRT